MVSFRKYLLLERIVGNTGWVYHRTKENPEDSDIVKYGIKPSSNQSAMYGKGLYCCYDFDQQLKSGMKRYGAYILKGKIDLNGFAILDKDVFRLANPRGDFEKHLKEIGTHIGEFERILPYTSNIANKIWKKCKQNGYNGIIFYGGTDGKVAVIWNRRNFIPYQYTKDDGKSWEKLSPDISSIKRKEDSEYDKDDEAIKFSKILKELSNKEEIGDLTFPYDYNGIVFLKKLQKSGNIGAYNAKEINLPQLRKSGNIEAPNNAKEINLPQLQTSGSIYANNAEEIILPKLQTSGSIYANNAEEIILPKLQTSVNIGAYNAKEINLPQLRESGRINANNAKKINLPQLRKSWGIHADNAKEIIIPKHLKYKLKNVPSDCEIVFVEDEQEIKVNENVTFKKYLMLKESLVQIPLDTAYEIFKNEYEKSTGSSWSRDKFFGRARAWEFYGDEKGYVAVRRQRSGFVKLVGMAGDNRSKLKGINDLVSMNLPLWGMVSKDIKDIAVRRGMREPNFLEKQVLKRSIPPEVLGDAKILEFQKDGGVKIEYPDVGIVVKYLVGTPQYYSKLREMFGDKIKEKILG
jgi:hypothetical protein